MRDPATLQDMFLYILDNYESSKDEDLKEHSTGNMVRQQLKHQLILDANLSDDMYAVTGSVGQGQWAEIPWVAIFLKQLTIRATKGYDIVYLFPADMSGVYISLNQGWTYFKEKYGTKEGSKKIITVANVVRERLHLVPEHLQLSSIDLRGRGELSKGYERGHIVGRFYPKEAFPSSQELIQDLQDLLTIYREVESLMEGRSVDQFNDYLLMHEDGYYVEEKEEDQYQETIAQHLEISALIVQEELVPYPLPRPKPIIFQQTQQWPRNAAIAAEAIHRADYQCEYDSSLPFFISQQTQRPFMEAHHLVPMRHQGMFDVSLDRLENIVCLSPHAHRMIHHAIDEEKEHILAILFEKRKDRLQQVGIELTYQELKVIYNTG